MVNNITAPPSNAITFDFYFYDPGFNGIGTGVTATGIPQYTWQYRMVGRVPFKGAEDDNDRHDDGGPVTHIRASIVPVTVDLRNADGSPRFVNGQRLISSPAAYMAPTLASPIFQPLQLERHREAALDEIRCYRLTDSAAHVEDRATWRDQLAKTVEPSALVKAVNRALLKSCTNPSGSMSFVDVDDIVSVRTHAAILEIIARGC